MPSKNNAEELSAVREARSLLQTNPKEAPQLLEEVVLRHQRDQKTVCALEARRWQCFAYMANFAYEEACKNIAKLIAEANEAGHRRFLGIAQMYQGVIAVECGESDSAVEYFAQAIQIATELEDLDLVYRVQTNLAYAQTRQERYEDALQTLKHCIRQFDVDNVSVSNATIYYNIAGTTIHLAFQEWVLGVLTTERVQQAESALATAQAECHDDIHLNLLTQVISCVYLGLAGQAEKGLANLLELEQRVDRSTVSHHFTLMVAKCQLLELAGMWAQLCDEAVDFVSEMTRTKSFAYLQCTLRQSARAHAAVGDYETAYKTLTKSAGYSFRVATTDGAKIASMRLDLEQKKFDQEVLRMRNKTLIERNKILEQEARYDPLSTLLNRRGTEEALQQFTERKFAESFVIVMLDIDHFKKINDNFGHAIGDQVIHEFAQCLSTSTTNPAKLGRWGGEEFLLVYDVTDPGKMDEIGQTLVSEIRDLKWDHIHADLNVTASCGLAMWHRGDSLDNAVRIADDMMYDVKHHGRNNWRVWTEDMAA